MHCLPVCSVEQERCPGRLGRTPELLTAKVQVEETDEGHHLLDYKDLTRNRTVCGLLETKVRVLLPHVRTISRRARREVCNGKRWPLVTTVFLVIAFSHCLSLISGDASETISGSDYPTIAGWTTLIVLFVLQAPVESRNDRYFLVRDDWQYQGLAEIIRDSGRDKIKED
ncbi:hypothetical protein RUM44_008364 [Polyplax serrata]|uniref:Uncharacterized protein n=1 Tax=Polyplax serrata TaxID=468196 RepID=A0ABR1B830_POLSC